MAQWFLDDVMEGEIPSPDKTGMVVISEPGRIEVELENGRTLALTGEGANVEEPLAVGARVTFRRVE